MTVASEITRIENNIAAAYTAASGKGATLPATENSANLATCVSSIPSGGGSTGKYALLDRVKDDSNNEIGTVCGFFTDANDTEYAVVCLDAQYRPEGGLAYEYSSNAPAEFVFTNGNNALEANITATQNTAQLISEGGSDAAELCREVSFTIDNTVYYGQLPNLAEVFDICRHRTAINTADTSGNQYTGVMLPNVSESYYLTSTMSESDDIWMVAYNGFMALTDQSGFVATVLEIPNAV